MGRTIALVEDEAAIRENYADALRRQGYEISTYGNRRAAMQYFRGRLPQLVARIAALFRRVEALRNPVEKDAIVRLGKLVIDKNRILVEWAGRKIDLTLTEFWIVHSIAHIPGYVKSREQLMSEANMFVDEGTITSHIKRIRKKFMAADPAFDCIETIYGMGYRWNAE